jgi:hypothetical protein
MHNQQQQQQQQQQHGYAKRCPMEEERRRMCAQAALARGGGGGGGEGGECSTVMAQLHEAEKRYASLMSKCAMLEEESNNYKSHMQSVVGRYQGELRKLRHQHEEQQQTADV